MGAEQGTLIRETIKPAILAGRELAALPKEMRHPIVSKVHSKVRSYDGVMRPVKMQDLKASIREGRSIGAFSEGISAYAQIWPLENPGHSGLPEGTMEVGTWVSFVSGMGPWVIPPATELAVREFGAPMAVALVRQGNVRAHETLLDLGAEPITERPSDYIPGKPMMTVFTLPIKI